MLSESSRSRIDLEKRNLKQKVCVRWNTPRRKATLAIGVIGGHKNIRCLTRVHLQQALIESLHDLTKANGEAERLVVIQRGPELFALSGEVACTVNGDLLPHLWYWSSASLLHSTSDTHVFVCVWIETVRKSGRQNESLPAKKWDIKQKRKREKGRRKRNGTD